MIRKKLAFLTSMVMALGMVSAFPLALGAESKTENTQTESKEDQTLKAALIHVKSRIDIPENMTEFDYQFSESYGIPCYTFYWNTPREDSYEKEENYEECSLNLIGNVITSYSMKKSGHESGNMRFSPLSEENFQKNAEDFIARVNPETAGKIVLKEEPSLSIYSDDVTLSFVRAEQGMNFNQNRASVTMNKMTGEVIEYHCNWWENALFPDVTKVIGEEKMQDIYRDEIKLSLVYRVSYDTEKEKYIARPVYSPKNDYEYDALTGKHTSMYEDEEKYENTDLYDDTDFEYDETDEVSSGEGYGWEDDMLPPELTEAELAAIINREGLLTDEQFREILKNDPYIRVTDNYMTEEFTLTEDNSLECGYRIDVRYVVRTDDERRSYSISADARTGKIISFSGSQPNSGKLLDVTAANALADEAAEYYFGDKVTQYFKPNEANFERAHQTADKHGDITYTETERDLSYDRFHNDIYVDRDYVAVRVNSDGKVLGASCSFTEDMEFEGEKCINTEEAFDRLFARKKFDLYFDGFTDLKIRPHLYLIYHMDRWSLNAASGKLCDYRGRPLSDEKETSQIPERCPYTDIGNSPYKDEIAKLYNYGVRISADKNFMPQKYITMEEMEHLLFAMGFDVYVEKEEREKTATNLRLAKLISDKFPYLKNYNEIFRSPYTDIPDDHDDIASIAIAYTAGLIQPDANGKFNPNLPITREEALHMTYRYIIRTYEEGREKENYNTGDYY